MLEEQGDCKEMVEELFQEPLVVSWRLQPLEQPSEDLAAGESPPGDAATLVRAFLALPSVSAARS